MKIMKRDGRVARHFSIATNSIIAKYQLRKKGHAIVRWAVTSQGKLGASVQTLYEGSRVW